MSAEEHIARIITLISTERGAIRDLFCTTQSFGRAKGLACLNLTRAMDTAMWCAEVGSTDSYHKTFAYLRTGFNRALALFLEADVDLQEVPDVPVSDASIRWAETTLSRLARLAQAERVVHLHGADLIRFAEATPSQIIFDVTAGLGLPEERDRSASRWLTATTVEQDKNEYAQLMAERPRIRQLMGAHVRLDGDQLVYGAHSQIDAFFRRLARLYVRRSVGHESIAPSAEFGGVSFSTYVAGLIELIAAAYKHVNFVSAVVTLSAGKVTVPTTITRLTSLADVSEQLASAVR